MPINFHDEQNRSSYATRKANKSWYSKISEHIEVQEKKAVDIGCGGGIYTIALLQLGASHITAVDYSNEMLRSAKENCAMNGYTNVTFTKGNALQTTLEDEQFDLVLQRALIHHIQRHDLPKCFQEAYRLLKEGGTLIVQDRTPEDCLLEGSPEHVRGYFFEAFPQLIETETSRRHPHEDVQQALLEAGFSSVVHDKLWETRKEYESKEELLKDIKNRTGRSILHELSDREIEELVDYINERVGIRENNTQGNINDGAVCENDLHNLLEIVEKDRWALWFACK